MSPAQPEPISKTELAWLKSGNIINNQRLVAYEEMELLERELSETIKELDCERSGYERGVREAAKAASFVGIMDGLELKSVAKFDVEVHEAILSLLTTTKEETE